jgi:maltose O-acetyltransferase
MNYVYRFIKRLVYHLRGSQTTEFLIERGLVVGSGFNRNVGVIIDPSHCWLIHIGDNVTLAPRVHILAHDASTRRLLGYTRIGNVDIGNNVFVGAGTYVMPGVTIGDNVVIGANSTVTHSIPANSVAVGSPARVICSIEDYVARNRELLKTRPRYGEEYTVRHGVTKEQKEQMYRELQDGPGFVV